MTSIELKKMQLELMQVQVARMALELRSEEMLAEVERLKNHIEIQQLKELELQEKLSTNAK